MLGPAEREFADDPRTLRVVLDMRIPEGTWGGVQQAAMGLAYGLSLLGAGRERYFFLAFKGESNWLRPLLKGDCELVEIETPSRHWTSLRNRLWSIGFARPARLIGRVADRDSAKVVRRLRAQIVHSTHQLAFKTTARRIYQPHDLQHLHFPPVLLTRRSQTQERPILGSLQKLGHDRCHVEMGARGFSPAVRH